MTTNQDPAEQLLIGPIPPFSVVLNLITTAAPPDGEAVKPSAKFH